MKWFKDSTPWLRSVRWALTALLTLIGVGAAVTIGLNLGSSRAASNQCRVEQRKVEHKGLECLGHLKPSSLTLELAGTVEHLSCQLRADAKNKAPSLKERECIEARIALRRDELRQLDARILIPLYVTVALLIAIWVALDASGKRKGAALIAAFLVAAATVALAVFDAMENQKTLQVLKAAEATGALDPDNLAALTSPVQHAHAAALRKWEIAAPWSFLIGIGTWLAARDASTWAGRFAWVGGALNALGGLLIGTAVLWPAAGDNAWHWQVELLGFGFFTAAGGLVMNSIAIACSRLSRPLTNATK